MYVFVCSNNTDWERGRKNIRERWKQNKQRRWFRAKMFPLFRRCIKIAQIQAKTKDKLWKFQRKSKAVFAFCDRMFSSEIEKIVDLGWQIAHKLGQGKGTHRGHRGCPHSPVYGEAVKNVLPGVPSFEFGVDPSRLKILKNRKHCIKIHCFCNFRDPCRQACSGSEGGDGLNTWTNFTHKYATILWDSNKRVMKKRGTPMMV